MVLSTVIEKMQPFAFKMLLYEAEFCTNEVSLWAELTSALQPTKCLIACHGWTRLTD